MTHDFEWVSVMAVIIWETMFIWLPFSYDVTLGSQSQNMNRIVTTQMQSHNTNAKIPMQMQNPNSQSEKKNTSWMRGDLLYMANYKELYFCSVKNRQENSSWAHWPYILLSAKRMRWSLILNPRIHGHECVLSLPSTSQSPCNQDKSLKSLASPSFLVILQTSLQTPFPWWAISEAWGSSASDISSRHDCEEPLDKRSPLETYHS